MSDILIVEDDMNKLSHLQQLVSGEAKGSQITVARSLQSSIRAVRGQSFSLVILDMTLPNFDTGPDESGGSTHPFGGREFLSQLERFDLEIPVIVVTQFESFGIGAESMTVGQLNEQLTTRYPGTYKGMVYYHAAIQGWEQELSSLIRASLADRSC